MTYQCEEAKLSANEIEEIYHNMEVRGLMEKLDSGILSRKRKK